MASLPDLGIGIGPSCCGRLDEAMSQVLYADQGDRLERLRDGAELRKHDDAVLFLDHVLQAAGCNLLPVPLAAGVLAPTGFVLRRSVEAILMSVFTVVVALNAQLLRRLDLRSEASSQQRSSLTRGQGRLRRQHPRSRVRTVKPMRSIAARTRSKEDAP